MNVGITVAGSEACKGCSLSFPLGNTASEVSVTRNKNTLVITPFSPFAATFNGKHAVFTEVRLYHPAPLRVEGVQADAVLQCMDGESMTLFIPLVKSAGGSGSAVSFLSTIAAQLDPGKSSGLGIVNKDSGNYETITVPTGGDWSLTQLVDGKDPYFTWMNSELQQYTKSDSECFRRIGWKNTEGAQVIYFQNPVTVSASDIEKLTATVMPVMPASVLSTVQHPLYSKGNAKNCPPILPSLKKPGFKMDKGLNSFMTYFMILAAALLGIVVAIAFVNSNIMKPVAAGFTRLMSWRSPKPGPPPLAPGSMPAGLKLPAGLPIPPQLASAAVAMRR